MLDTAIFAFYFPLHFLKVIVKWGTLIKVITIVMDGSGLPHLFSGEYCKILDILINIKIFYYL
jgi:hypothetical protein